MQRSNANVRELNVQLTQVIGQLDAERRRGDEMNRLCKAKQVQCWGENPVEMMDMAQLGQLKTSLQELRRFVNQHADRIMIHASNTINNNAPPGAPPSTLLLPAVLPRGGWTPKRIRHDGSLQ